MVIFSKSSDVVSIMVNTWQWIGYSLVIYYAGLQSLNIELLEASDIDGANWVKKYSQLFPYYGQQQF